jgi:hypothetical protein
VAGLVSVVALHVVAGSATNKGILMPLSLAQAKMHTKGTKGKSCSSGMKKAPKKGAKSKKGATYRSKGKR